MPVLPLSRFGQTFRHALASLLLAFFLLCCILPPPTGAAENKDVLIIHSYHPGLRWTDDVMAGMREVLGPAGNIDLHVEYLDTLRYPTPDYPESVLDGILHHKLEGRTFDLVLASDNPALLLALKHRDDLFLNTPIVFCGVNNFAPAMLDGFTGVTGVAEIPSYRETIETALRLHPETKEVVVIGGYANVTHRQNRRMLEAVLAENRFPPRFTFWDDVPVEDLSERLAKLPPTALVLVNGAVASRRGELLPYDKGMQAIRQASRRPIYSFWGFFLGEGIVGGKLVHGREQGRIAAEAALRILGGEDPAGIPVNAETNRFMFDYLELERFSLPEQRLPPESVVVNEPPPFYSLSLAELWGIVGVMAALAVVLSASIVLLRRAKSAVEQENKRVDLLLHSTAEAIYGIDLEGRCTFCNPSSLRLLGYREESDLLGKKLHPLIHHTRADGTPNPVSECLAVKVLTTETAVHGENEVLWRADGTSFPIEYWAHPIGEGKEKAGVLVTFLDISERKAAEAERERALQELNAFVYTVSHDLRSPLAAMIGFSDYLLDQVETGLDENARTALAEIQKQGERMSAMMEDLLALARVGKLPRPATAVDVGAIVGETLREFRTPLGAAGLSVRIELLPAVHVPATFLTQIFANLIGNAIRYAASGGLIEIGGRRQGGQVRYFVRDHGPGIPPAERERIFDVFFRGSTGEKIDGTGIGLATVRKIALFYAGAAWVEETPGGGATFWVELADHPPSAIEIRNLTPEPTPASSPAVQPR